MILGAGILVGILGLAGWTVVYSTDPAPRLLTGELWQRMSPDAKVAFVWGVANLVELERAQAGAQGQSAVEEQTGGPGAGARSFVPFLVRGLRGKSINDVVREVDAYYAARQDQLARPVIDAIFQAIVLPALRADKDGGRTR